MSCCNECKDKGTSCQSKKMTTANPVYISIAKMKEGDLYELLKFAFFADKKEFIKAFQKAKVTFHDIPEKYKEQLEFLAWLGTSGADRAGKLRMEPGQVPLHFSVKDTYGTIMITKKELDNSPIVLIP